MPDSAELEMDVPAPPPGVLLAAHWHRADGYQVRRSRGTFDWMLTYTHDGAGVYRLDDVDRLCTPGTVAILLPGTPHDYRTQTESTWEFSWVHFIPRPQWLDWLQLAHDAGGLIQIPIADSFEQTRLEAAFARMIHDSAVDSTYGGELAQNALEEILLIVMQRAASDQPRHDPRIDHALTYLAAHLGDSISVETLADQVAMSPSGFAHLFKAQVGVSPMQMLIRLRLRQASRLLEHTTHPIHQIAHELGFESPFHFSRVFKAWYQVSPKHYRQSKMK